MSGCSCLPVTLVVLQIIALPSVTQDKRNMIAKWLAVKTMQSLLIESTDLGPEISTSLELMIGLQKMHQAGSQDVSVVAR